MNNLWPRGLLHEIVNHSIRSKGRKTFDLNDRNVGYVIRKKVCLRSTFPTPTQRDSIQP